MRAEWFIWANLGVFLHVEMVSYIFQVLNELLNLGEEDTTILLLLLEGFRKYHEIAGLILRAVASQDDCLKRLFTSGTNKNYSGFIKTYANVCVSINFNSFDVFSFLK